MATCEVYAAIRKTSDSGKEWIDIDSISLLFETTKDKAKKTDDYITYWAKDNPVVRISKVNISEVK